MKRLFVVLSVVAAICAGVPGLAQEELTTIAESSEHVKRALFTSSILDREPTDKVETVLIPADKVFFFTEVTGLEGKTITHRWMFGGEEKASVPFKIGGPRWRVYSSKILKPEWVGDWTVEVLDTDGNIIHRSTLVYGNAE